MAKKKVETESLRGKIIIAVITAVLSVIGALVVWKITKGKASDEAAKTAPASVIQSGGTGNIGIGTVTATDGGSVNVTITNNTGGSNTTNTILPKKKTGIFLINEDYLELSFLQKSLKSLLQNSKEDALFEVKIGYDADAFTGNEKNGFFYEGDNMILQINGNKYDTKIPIYSYKKNEQYSGRSKKALLEDIRKSINDALNKKENQNRISSIIQKECKR